MQYATKTLQAIEDTIAADQGAAYRGYLKQVMPHMDDAYSTDNFPFRSHMGASGIGEKCARKIWYGFNWAIKPKFLGRIVRLFNRGHLEEARFIAMLLTIGVQVYQQDANGEQYRITGAGGHFGGSGDGILIGVPDLPEGTACLAEFKTSSDKYFKQMQIKGVCEAKFEHYVQMNCYMHGLGLGAALYLMVNKNTDALYGEIIHYDSNIAAQYFDRAENLVYKRKPPNKINESPGWYECKYCDFNRICHHNELAEKNCRTCECSTPELNGTWSCSHQFGEFRNTPISKENQLKGCIHWSYGKVMPR